MQITEIMYIYEDVFNPIIVVLTILIFLIIFSGDKKKLRNKIRFYLVILSPVIFAVIVYYLFFPSSPEYLEDIVISGAYLVSFGDIYIGYKRRIINKTVFSYFFLLFIGSIPYFLISPFWNISGHILFSGLPILFLILFNKRFFPLILIHIVMLFNRPIVNAHTWSQAIFTFFFTFFVFLIFHLVRKKYLTSIEI